MFDWNFHAHETLLNETLDYFGAQSAFLVHVSDNGQ
jgi:hypothetical protein